MIRFFLFILITLFIWGCAGSSLLYRRSLVVESQGCALVSVHGLLIAVTFVAELGPLDTGVLVVASHGLSSCGSQL